MAETAPPAVKAPVRSHRRPSRITGRAARRAAVRLATSLLVFWGALTASFFALQAIPGSTVDALLGNNDASMEVRQQIISDYGLDRPLHAQYLTYVGRALLGDLGRSYQLDQPVTGAIGAAIVPSLQLTAAGLALGLAVATALALATAHRRRAVRSISSGVELVGVSVPVFWAAILLLTLFSFRLGWFPAVGGDSVAALVLPAVAIAIPVTAVLTQVMREGLERALDEPFVLTARARGMTDAAVRLRHALRHALLPVVTLVGWLFGALLGGIVVTEKVFGRPGLGRLVVDAVVTKDLPVVLGVVICTAALYIVINIALDLFYPVIDPRLRGVS
ncbi:ABC transporter permease [Actinomadura flavalba]|uniref:ABC transporter permease n=1 Tax=Actinomadura flavalba TaxID=1120938 RepID=UPI00036BB60B|nr:ABC transporter permease [Actinomadura flavalba]